MPKLDHCMFWNKQYCWNLLYLYTLLEWEKAIYNEIHNWKESHSSRTTQQKQSKKIRVYGKRWVANLKQRTGKQYVFNKLVIQLLSCVWLFVTSWTAAAGLWPLLSPGVCSKGCSLSLWFYLSIASSAAP